VPQETINEALAQWPGSGAESRYVRELYHALKMLEPGVTLDPNNGGNALAKRLSDVTRMVYGNGAAVNAAWRPMCAVVVDEKDLPRMQLPGD